MSRDRRRRWSEVRSDLAELHARHCRNRGRIVAAAHLVREIFLLGLWALARRPSRRLPRPSYRARASAPREPQMDHLLRDLRLSLRGLRRQPAFAIVTIATLAAGIGGSTAMFSLVNGVLIEPLPVPDADRLVVVWETTPHGTRTVASAANYASWSERSKAFERLAVHAGWSPTLLGVDEPRTLRGARVSANFLPMLGLEPMLGRNLTAADERADSDAIVLLSYELWQRDFGGDPGIVGQSVHLEGGAATVIGVLPTAVGRAGFTREIYAPMRLQDGWLDYRGRHNVLVFGRLADGLDLGQAQAGMNVLADAMAQEYPETNAGYGVDLEPLKSMITAEAQGSLMLLLGAVSAMLLIGCLNAANLMMARAQSRARDLAVLAALGAGRRRLLRLLLTESAIMALAAGLLGLVAVSVTHDALRGFVPAGFPRLDEVGIDLRVVGFALGTTALTVFVFGALPAMAASRVGLQMRIFHAGTTTTSDRSSQRAGRTLIVAEFALAALLLVVAGLFVRTLVALNREDLGIDVGATIEARVEPGNQYTESERLETLYRQILQPLAMLPGVEQVAATSHLPLAHEEMRAGFSIEGGAQTSADGPQASFRVVTPNYFHTLRIPLIAGREFGAEDDRSAASRLLVNEALARTYFDGNNPVGRRISFIRDDEGEPIWSEIVGVVGDVRHFGPGSEPVPEMYQSFQQADSTWRWFGRSLALVVRYEHMPVDAADRIRALVHEIDPNIPVRQIRTFEALRQMTVSGSRFLSTLLLLFGVGALTLSAVGVYGVLSFQVRQRQQEVGIRMALGARGRDVVAAMVLSAMTPALAGLGIGVVAGAVAGRGFRHMFFGVPAIDWVTYAAVVTVLVAAALLACLQPARRAANADPARSLRTG